MRKPITTLLALALLSGCAQIVSPVPEDPAAMERAEGQAAPDPAAVGEVLTNMPKGSGGAEARQAVARGEPVGAAELRAARAAPKVGPGVLLPFGAIGKACDVQARDMGGLIEKNGKWKLYDARPGSTAVRNFFVTGFKDGCPRQVTGAVALFGDLQLYELVHFGGGGGQHGTATDAAYAQLRSRDCRGAGACSEKGVKKLARSTAFLSVYPAPGASRSMELLMHKRELVAKAVN